MRNKVVVAVAGGEGAVFARDLLKRLTGPKVETEAVAVVLTEAALLAWRRELGTDFRAEDFPGLVRFGPKDFLAPFASGSARYDVMIVCPCDLGVLGRVASGVSDDLVTRAADVVLKERRRMVLVPTEAPYGLIHLRNMVALTEAGVVVCPAVPAAAGADLAARVAPATARTLRLAGLMN